MSRKHYIAIADSLANSLAQSNDKDFTYAYFRGLCTPFMTALKEDNSRFDAERFVAYSYDAYREYRSNGINYNT